MRALSGVATAIAAVAAVSPTLAIAQPVQAARTCIIRVSPIDFGVYDQRDPAPTPSVGRVLVQCLRSVVLGGPKVTLTAGYSGRLLDRTMLSGRGALHYNLYTDPAHQFVAGDGTQGTSPLAQAFRSVGITAFRFYGAIGPRQLIPAGEYSDDVQVEVEF